jgi:hypothetical protein
MFSEKVSECCILFDVLSLQSESSFKLKTSYLSEILSSLERGIVVFEKSIWENMLRMIGINILRRMPSYERGSYLGFILILSLLY